MTIEELTQLERERLQNKRINLTEEFITKLLITYSITPEKDLFPKEVEKVILNYIKLAQSGDIAVEGKYAITYGDLEKAFLLGQKSITDLNEPDIVAEYLQEEMIPTYYEYLKTLPKTGEAQPKLKLYNER